ncbi:MAG: DMT family transporter [Promethearchaeota archaeon]
MNNKLKKGLVFGVIGNFFVGFQPIIANSRPAALDAHIFASLTCLVEAVIFLPLIIIEKKVKIAKNNNANTNHNNSMIKTWRKNIWLFLFIGIIFGLNQLLFFIGYELAGEINGSLTQKTTVFFGLIFGFLILKERITKVQIIFSTILFFGLIFAISQGSFNLLTLSLDILSGVLIMLLITCLWMFGHSITKPVFDRDEATPTQMVFIRNLLSGIILFSTYFLFFPFKNISLLFVPINQFYYISMGVVYGAGLYCWYKTLSYLDVSKATILFSPTPIITAIFAALFVGKQFTIFHFIGSVIVILSIVIIAMQKNNKNSIKQIKNVDEN